MRLQDRLRFDIAVPAELRMALVPPLMLGTLVENAIKHGIGPKALGGQVHISARREGCALLVIEVSDDGAGFRGESGTGLGLANTRARLGSLYGDEGSLELRRSGAGGVTASIRIPLRVSSATASVRPELTATRNVKNETNDATFFMRLARALTFKHLIWPLALGVAVPAVFQTRKFTSNFEVFGSVWVVETALAVLTATLFMLALVLIEVFQRAGLPSIPRYIAAVLGAATVAAMLYWNAALPHIWAPQASALRNAQIVQAERDKLRGFNPQVQQLFYFGARTILLAMLGSAVYIWIRHGRRQAQALAAAELQRAEAERVLLLSRIEAVEAEVDPSAVFATLEAIENAYPTDRETADAMLDEMIVFLRAAIPRLRAERPMAA
jgi:hypothetical protein